MKHYSFIYDLIILAPVLFGLVRGIGKGGNAFGRIFEATWGAVKYALIVMALIFVLNLIDGFFPFMPEEIKMQSFLYSHIIEWCNALLSLIGVKFGE